MPPVPDHEMIVQGDPEQVGTVAQAVRHGDVGLGRGPELRQFRP
jgi:hypothetical protein